MIQKERSDTFDFSKKGYNILKKIEIPAKYKEIYIQRQEMDFFDDKEEEEEEEVKEIFARIKHEIRCFSSREGKRYVP